MPARLEITLQPALVDAEGEALRRKAREYFGIETRRIRTVQILMLDAALDAEELERIRREIFTNPVTQRSAWGTLDLPADWVLWVGLRPGVRDNAGATAIEAIEDLLGRALAPGEAAYTSKRYCIEAPQASRRELERIAAELLANDLIQQWRLWSAAEWDPREGIGWVLPKVRLDRRPRVTPIPVAADEELLRISRERGLALHPRDIPVIRAYFQDPRVREARRAVGLGDPTDVELEYVSQARSDHCNHNTFRGRFHYREAGAEAVETIDNLFATFIEEPTLAIARQKPWVVSVLWDNAGAGRLDEGHHYVITGETHNSPSNMEAYGGAITGIVGVYRDPLGTGRGAKLILGGWGFCVGPRDYAGPLRPRLHPRRLLDGVVEGVRDGGNKSGIPTVFGQLLFDPGYMGKCLVFVTAVGIMPARVAGEPSEQKTTTAGDLIVMCGGRVGKDGIHGVTASSEVFSAHTPAGHVQIGDPYTQKKMHDFLLEARDEGLIRFITDNGGGGLSSSIGESARFSGGAEVALEKVPLKYEGLDPWEIWVSESQERMTVAVRPEDVPRFLELSRLHGVESTVIGRYTDSGKLHLTYAGETCAFVDLDLLRAGFPQWEFEAEWTPPERRGLTEPVLGEPGDCTRLLLDLLSSPNLASTEWIARQYDHEVQGGSVLKPLLGVGRDVPADAAVLRPLLSSPRGLAYAQAILPFYSRIDAYAMTACTIDEAFRRVLAVGGDPDHVGGVDNFCWPSVQYDPVLNPDGRFKAAQLVRACRALKETCLAYGIPLLSGKDSMYVDGHLPGSYGETHKVSALETIQFSTISLVEDVRRCVSPEIKVAGDLLFAAGLTRDELGGSEYYRHLGYTGLKVPQVRCADFLPLYRAIAALVREEQLASLHGVYRGGLAVHLALIAVAGGLGLRVDARRVPAEGVRRLDTLLFSESAGRFLFTADPARRRDIEARLQGFPVCCIGEVVSDPRLEILGLDGRVALAANLEELAAAWKRPFGHLAQGGVGER